MASIPSALALATITDSSLITASSHRNNYAAIQAAVNALAAALDGGAAGQFLQAVDGTDVQWVNTTAAALVGKMLAMSSANANIAAGTLPTAGYGYTRLNSTDGSNVANITGGNSTVSDILFLWNATGSTVTFVTGGAAGSALHTGFSLENNHGALLLYETTTASWIRLGMDDPASTAATLAQVFAAGVQSAHPSQGVGYATGAGGTVTQTGTRASAVTINKATGKITTDTTSLANGSSVQFTVNNSALGGNDVVVVVPSVNGGTVADNVKVAITGPGTFTIAYTNNSGGPSVVATTFTFVVIKGAIA
jgi:hypothetical protein